MIRLVVELTNRCNLRCVHCFDDRHAGTDDLPHAVLRRLLEEASAGGVAHLSFTGGEPTLHRRFREIIGETVAAGCSFSFVSNGSTFPRLYSWLGEYRQAFHGVTFSLDGAHERTHDRLRGPGSFRSVMRAASICVARRLPFTLNMVLTRQNRSEIDAMIELAARLGSGGIRFGHLMPGSPGADELELLLDERRAAEQEIWDLRSRAAVPVGMAAGYHSDSPFFPCGPIALEEFNVDCRGNVTLCCHLSGYGDHLHGRDRAGNLAHTTLRECLARLRSMVHEYQATKRRRFERGELTPRDYSPCLYCVRHFGEAAPLQVIRPGAVARPHPVSTCQPAR